MSDLIDNIIKREGSPTNDPNDAGGRTQFGISERSNPEAWRDGNVTYGEAHKIYEQKYIAPFSLLKSHVVFEHLIDWGVTSGPQLVIQKVQAATGSAIDGILGPETLAAIEKIDPRTFNNQMVAEHIRMIGRIVQKNPAQLKYLSGWLARALGFLQ